MKEKVVVAMSGGVDSTIAALLLLKQGYDVIGLTMDLPVPEEKRASINDAKLAASEFDIPLHVVDCRAYFENIVIDNFIKEYRVGRTPCPCFVCNRFIKFGLLLKEAKKLGAKYLATGHYARIDYDDKNGRFLLKKGSDAKKDQSYFLSSLMQDQLKHVMFPLGAYTKEEIRNIARDAGLKVHSKSDSQEICFIDGNKYREFLKKTLSTKEKKGSIKFGDKIVGRHTGISDYTLGQRKGIGAHKEKVYVTEIDYKNNTIVIGRNEDLYKDECIISDINWIGIESLEKSMEVKTKIRYKSKESESTIYPFKNGKVKVEFKESQRAITPGQVAVFYKGNTVVGGGFID